MGDLIRRTHLQITLMDLNLDHIQAEDGRELCQIVDDEPSVNPQNTANWVGIDDEPYDDYECNNCGRVVTTETPYADYKYCPNCGCRMM